MWKWIFIIALILNLIDWITTWYILQHGGSELNFIVKKLGLTWAKIIGFVGIIGFYLLWPYTSILFVAIFGFACIWNTIQYFKQKELSGK